MKLLLLILLVVGNAYASSKLAPDWVQESASTDASSEISEIFNSILDAEAEALDKIAAKENHKLLPFGFQMKEMVTDIGVSRSGLMGVAAMNASRGVELKWKKVAPQSEFVSEEEPGDFVVESGATEEDLDSMAESIVNVVKASGKVKSKNLKVNVMEALVSVQNQVKNIEVTTYQEWQARHLRLDLNFALNGSIWFFARAGVAVRVRTEWKLKDLPLTSEKLANINDETKFVVKVLGELNEALTKVNVMGFEPKKVFIGVGASQKKRFFGIWKYNAGFIGWLGFVPVKVTNTKALDLVRIPADIMNEPFSIGEVPSEKGLWPFRRRSIVRASFQAGLTKSLQTAAFFAEQAQNPRSAQWSVAEIKTANEISYTGFFGLADVTTRGNVEIDFKRK